MPIGEVFLGAFVTVLLERLASHALLKFLRPTGIDAQLKKWRKTLLIIEAVLTDAENQQSMNKPVKEWLEELEDLAYDLDDIVDELNTEALHRKLIENQASTSKVRKLIPTCCTNFSLADFQFDRRITSKLNEISSRLEGLHKQIGMLKLVQNVTGVPYHKPERLQMTSLVVKSEVRGREKERDDILKMLLETDESNDSPLTVIPIVGMGGVGKTTLAQLVYNDDKLKEAVFDIKAWACVSDEFDALRITKTILDTISSERYQYDDLNNYQVKLQENLSKKKFLIVLDDVWNEKYGDWDILRQPFLAGKPGSKIIVTTRQQKVAKMMSRVRAYHLNELLEADALSLLAQHALDAKDFDVRSDLREVGKSIVRRCKNLPLAVKAIGGILRTKTSAEEWEGILNSEIWRSGEKSEILPALKLSYHYLPSNLKPCFAFCAIYPKDYEFDKTELVYLWMAEGFLQQPQEKSMEELGADYFDELLSRSFFQEATFDASRFIMHDLINDLAAFVSGYKFLRLEDMVKGNLGSINSGKPRHLSFIPQRHESYDRFSSISCFQSLRTFLSIPNSFLDINCFGQRVLHETFSKLYCVREISLRQIQIYELPENIGDLRHLRYLNLYGNTELRCLPNSVSNLFNLEVLILENCDSLVKLPTRIENLISIRHLNIENTFKLHEMPSGIARLTSLQTLSKMVVSESDGLKISDLKDLSSLKGKISICKLQNVENVQEAIDARLNFKSSLNEIRLVWSCELDDSRNGVLELDVLEALKPHENLSSLGIQFYGGVKFSSWIENLSSFSKLTKLSFNCCKRCMTLPNLGQLPLLRDLSIQGMDGVKVIGTEFFYGNGELVFPLLENLYVTNMPEWEEWHGLAQSAIEFPKLRALYIRKCPKLVKLPFLSCPLLEYLNFDDMPEWEEWDGLAQSAIEFPKLRNLNIRRCPKLVKLPFRLCPSLVSLTFEDMPEWEEWNGLAQSAIEFPRLHILQIEKCPKLVQLPALSLPSMFHLRVESCNEVILNRMSNLASLTFLKLQRIIGLTSILKAFEQFPLKLQTFEICECEDLETLWESDNLVQRLVNLKWLNITKCPKLLYVQEIGVLPDLHSFYIDGCSFLGMMTLEGCNTSLGGLRINECPNFNFTNLMGSLRSYSNLVRLRVSKCDGLESFPQGGLPTPNMRTLEILRCRNLKALPDQIEQLSSLVHLEVRHCPSLMEPFPQGNLPANLSMLIVSGLKKLKPLGQWELQKLTSLTYFQLTGGYPEVVSFAEGSGNDRRYLLPPSLIELHLCDMPYLENLEGFGNLTSLRHLYIMNCEKFVELPVEDQLHKLYSLKICHCPLIKKRCLKDKGDYWPIIAYIPEVAIY